MSTPDWSFRRTIDELASRLIESDPSHRVPGIREHPGSLRKQDTSTLQQSFRGFFDHVCLFYAKVFIIASFFHFSLPSGSSSGCWSESSLVQTVSPSPTCCFNFQPGTLRRTRRTVKPCLVSRGHIIERRVDNLDDEREVPVEPLGLDFGRVDYQT